MNGRERRKLRGLGWLTAGIGIGTLAALLSAPYTGEEVRFGLRRGYRRAAKRLSRRTEDFGKHSRKLLRGWRAA